MPMQVIRVRVNDALQLAHLHIKGIPTGFISSLGPQFVTSLYRAIAESNDSICLVAEENGTVLGFVAFTTNLKALYKSILLRNLRLSVLLFPHIFSIRTVKKILETLFYPKRVEKFDLPEAELLSIVVSPEARGKGIARSLVQEGLAECSRRGISEVKVLVAESNAPANRLYEKCGFQLRTQIENHGILSNIYVAQTNQERNASNETAMDGGHL